MKNVWKKCYSDELHHVMVQKLVTSSGQYQHLLQSYSSNNHLQKEKFRATLAQLEQGPSEEDLMFGMTGLGLQQGEDCFKW